ncbi:double-strand break repair protein AddB [Mariluticola halotolerans]|uniref:double-strand break repair protein AddB n=1 Tax=Mariluticola halotolerans TaxID=2909283 RepID=UPI0026E1346E|nr:double-strand break repair protein AddB [Mariluticola halotolerans]UJQ93319.1 double-strand break repair protein AddB [Mariluticola halotolerans]
MSRQNLFSIAPHAPFLKTLVERVCDGTLLGGWDASTPFGLSDVTIILPTRRARLVLAEAFAERLGGAALLPDIRTFGGAPEEEEPFLPPFEAPPIPKAITSLRRKLTLAQLVEAWVKKQGEIPGLSGFSTPPSAGEILDLADSLAELIDDCHIENVSPADLRHIAPENLAANWQATLEFLQLALEVWPAIREDLGGIDSASRRNIELARQAGAAPVIFGDRPVIAAGSTGSVPATAELLKAISRLERGVLVLPGLDTTLEGEAFAALIDPARAPHGHPQYGLAQLLKRLGTSPQYVEELASQPAARTTLVRQSLALADFTKDWAAQRAALASALPAALEGISIAIARTDEEQARAIALAAHDALARHQAVGIISPDRNLARRIAAELGRFEIEVDDSAGTPLFHSRIGRLARQALALTANQFAPVDLMALLRNKRTGLGLKRAELVTVADMLEAALLRGQRPAPGIAGLRARLEANLARQIDHVPLELTAADGLRVTALLEALERAFQPLCNLFEAGFFSVADFSQALGDSMKAITALADDSNGELWPEQRQFGDWLDALKAETGRGPRLSAHGIELALEGLMASASVRAPRAARPDIAIWGQLEARLQNPDLIILAGLSEGVWPEPADPGPWLSRAMRIAAGLEPPERRQGQAALDFEMALGNANVLITRAERVGTSPAVASRLLQRFEAFIGLDAAGALAAKGQVWVERARDLDFTGEPKPSSRPAPAPPAATRPRSLSITEIETLVRSPYDLYAKYVLKLRQLDPLGDDPDARERGTLIHAIFGDFVERGHDVAAPDALDILMALADEHLAALESLPERRTLWRERFRPAAEGFLSFERDRAPAVARRHAELKGEWQFQVAGEIFTLRGRADRIDQLADGSLEIIDFKTGAVPDAGAMRDFTAPQLLLEAAMAGEGAFEGVSPANASALTYIKIGAGPEAFVPRGFVTAKERDIGSATDEVVRRLALQVEAYLLSDTHPMAARIFPNPKQRHTGAYDHLARTGEWTLADGEEGE